MGSSVLESLRVFHEDIEQNEAAIALLLQSKYQPTTVTSTCTAIVAANSSTPPPETNISGNDKSSSSNFAAPYGLSSFFFYEVAASKLLKKVSDAAKLALEVYADEDGARKEEIAYLAGNPSSTDAENTTVGEKEGSGDVWTNFYDRIKAVKDYHRKFGPHMNSIAGGSQNSSFRSSIAIVSDVKRNLNDEIVDSSMFPGEERGGKKIDLTEFYNQFINIKAIEHFKEERHKVAEKARIRKKLALAASRHSEKRLSNEQDEGVENEEQVLQWARKFTESEIEALIEDYKQIDYITYLNSFDNFNEIPRSCRYRNKEYISYINGLLEKLQDFFSKTHPLAPMDKMLKKFHEEFEKQWKSGEVFDWQDPPTHQDSLYATYTDRLFSSAGPFNSHIKGKKYNKLEQKSQLSGGIADQSALVDKSLSHDKQMAEMEVLVGKFHTLLKQFFINSICHLQKKQSRSAKELEQEEEGEDEEGIHDLGEEEKEEDEDDEDDEDKPIYNPLSLPLGWDGKPIPFWLYKLHGLGVEYKCEICGNYSYWGRKAFEKHFQEWRHAMGMRCLKIPNTTHFKEITKIEDAITLYEKLKKEAEVASFKFEQEVECEDSQGNVMSARAYDDLRRQGLV